MPEVSVITPAYNQVNSINSAMNCFLIGANVILNASLLLMNGYLIDC